MKTIKPLELTKMDTSVLNDILYFNGLRYDMMTLTLVYAELKYRNYSYLSGTIDSFKNSKNYFDLEDALNRFLKSIGFSTYYEYRKSLVENIVVIPNQIYMTGNALVNVAALMVYQISSITIGMLIIKNYEVNNSNDVESIRNISFAFGILTLIFTVLIIKNIFTAGKSLKESISFVESSINEVNNEQFEIKNTTKPSF